MVYFKDECVGCPSDIGCLGARCIYRNVPHMVCDRCGCDCDSPDELRQLKCEQVCLSCLMEEVCEKYPPVEIEEDE